MIKFRKKEGAIAILTYHDASVVLNLMVVNGRKQTIDIKCFGELK